MQENRQKSGRPRDQSAADAIRKSALQLVRERGYRNVTIATIAKQAGVARQTLYNRWPTKADLVLDAVFRNTGEHTQEPIPTQGVPFANQLERFLVDIFRHLETDGDTLRVLIAAAQEDSSFQDAFREKFVMPRDRMVVRLLTQAQESGELGPDMDVDCLSVMLHGAFWYRLLNNQPLDQPFARKLAQNAFGRAIAA